MIYIRRCYHTYTAGGETEALWGKTCKYVMALRFEPRAPCLCSQVLLVYHRSSTSAGGLGSAVRVQSLGGLADPVGHSCSGLDVPVFRWRQLLTLWSLMFNRSESGSRLTCFHPRKSSGKPCLRPLLFFSFFFFFQKGSLLFIKHLLNTFLKGPRCHQDL